MIEIREVFRIYPEHMKEAIDLAKEARDTGVKNNIQIRVLTDLSSEFYSLIFEIEARNFEEYLLVNNRIHATEEWKDWYIRFRACIVKGRRELFTLIE